MANIEVARLTSADSTTATAISLLIKQLTTKEFSFTERDLAELINNPATVLFVLRCEGDVVGMLTVGNYLSPTGRKAWIEDVVVDAEFRGRKIGELLVEKAKDEAVALGAKKLYLTSNPSRKAAHALYAKCGFEVYETTLFRIASQKK